MEKCKIREETEYKLAEYNMGKQATSTLARGCKPNTDYKTKNKKTNHLLPDTPLHAMTASTRLVVEKWGEMKDKERE